MKNTKLTALALVMSFALIGCGSSTVTSSPEPVASIETSVEVSVDEPSPEEIKKELKKTVKSDHHLVWMGDVRNDNTGRWKLSEYSGSESLETFAADYYSAFFDSDDEIHAVINMATSVTGRISVIDSNTLDVTLFDYVEDEEHDANALFGGTLLSQYWVTISTGEIELLE